MQEPYAPLREGTQGDDPADVAVGHREPLHRADARARLGRGARGGRDADDRVDDAASSTSTRSSTRSTRRRAATSRTSSRASRAQFRGKGGEAGEAAKYFNPFLSTSRRLVGEVTEDEDNLVRFLVDSGPARHGAGREARRPRRPRRQHERDGARDRRRRTSRSARALGLLPTTLRRANTTFVNLRATLDDLDVLVAESKPATRELAPFLRELRPLVAASRPTIRDLRTLVRRAGRRTTTSSRRRASCRSCSASRRRRSRNGREALVKLQPVLEFIRPYTPEFAGWIRDFGQAASNYDANGHYARIQPIFNAFNFNDNPAGGVLTPNPPSQRFDGLETNQLRRCPGARVAAERGRLGAVARRQRHARLRSQPGAAGAMRAIRPRRPRAPDRRHAGRVLRRVARRERELPRARDLRQRRLPDPGRGRQGRRRQGRLDRGRSRSRPSSRPRS